MSACNSVTRLHAYPSVLVVHRGLTLSFLCLCLEECEHFLQSSVRCFGVVGTYVLEDGELFSYTHVT